jgi:2-amino-4-hydroxy-6-hydroxymethyldihydropteridine diphosphokinase
MTALEHQVCLLLGSNIQPEKNLAEAMERLGQKVKILRRSSVWETPAEGSQGPDFLNMAVLITTSLPEGRLKETILRPVERQLGRVRSTDKNAARTIDIDILVFDGRLLDPNLFTYAHQAVPVAEILPDYQSKAGDLLKEVASKMIENYSIRLKPDVLNGQHGRES